MCFIPGSKKYNTLIHTSNFLVNFILKSTFTDSLCVFNNTIYYAYSF